MAWMVLIDLDLTYTCMLYVATVLFFDISVLVGNGSFLNNRSFLPGYTWQDVYFDDESAEVVLSSLRLGDDQERYTEGLL